MIVEKITKYAKFIYSKDDEDLIDELENYLNMKAEDVFAFFDDALPRDLVEVRIIPSKNEYDAIVQKRRQTSDTPKWEIGTSHNGVIEYVSLHDYKSTSHAFPPEKYSENLEYYKKTIVHEFVHYVTYLYRKKYNIDPPLRYLNEGIAQYLSKQRDSIKKNFNSTLDDILNSRNNYKGWYLLTKFIIEQYGRDYFLELFGNQKKAYLETPRLYTEARQYYDNLNDDLNLNYSKNI